MKSDLSRLKDTFQKMDEDDFNTNLPLNWGYYFINDNKASLERLYEEVQEDYELNGLEKINSSEWRLYINKTEVLTPEGLHKKNIEFNELALKHSVSLYDGWDVEKL
jgi:hypothetical protein